MDRLLPHLLRWLVILAMPLFLLLTTARLLVADWYPRYEYAKPAFPRDPYGFTSAQRVEYAAATIHYLNAGESPAGGAHLLTDLRLPDGRPLYSTYEVGHLVDVKRVMDSLWRVQVIAAVIVVGGLLLLLARSATRTIGLNALLGGGLLTAGLLFVLGLFVILSFNTFFVQFHAVLFPQGNWTFDYSDSLIRLFPEKFWYDAGTLIAVSTLAEGIILAGIGYILGRSA